MDMMAIQQFPEDASAQSIYSAEDKTPLDKWKSISDRVIDSDESSGFDCNICLDSVQDPVVTLCGHLYCWPCIYKWLHFQSMSTENFDQQQCPACKAEVSEDTLVPLFSHGNCTKSSKSKAPNLGIIIPQRPLGLACGFGSPRSPISPTTLRPNHQLYQRNYPYESQPDYTLQGSRLSSPMLSEGATMIHISDPMIGVFGEMIYASVFGNSITNLYTYPNSYNLAGSASPRVRRHVMQADKSLSRICFFLFCCVFLCFLLF